MPRRIAISSGQREDIMLTTILTVSLTALLVVLLVWRSATGRAARRQPAYVCDVCNSQDCLCHLDK